MRPGASHASRSSTVLDVLDGLDVSVGAKLVPRGSRGPIGGPIRLSLPRADRRTTTPSRCVNARYRSSSSTREKAEKALLRNPMSNRSPLEERPATWATNWLSVCDRDELEL